MSLPSPTFDDGIPEETSRVARAAFPHGSLAISLRDVLGAVYHDGMFADLYPTEGQPAWSPWRLALVTVLQFAEHLTDRQAAQAVRGRIDWKYALGLSLTDAGFDSSILSTFRDRLVAGEAEERLLWAILEGCRDRHLLTGGGRQRTDATHVLAAVRRLNRLELVGETLRAALEVLAVVDAAWVREHIPTEWIERYGRRIEEYRLPNGEAARRALAEQIGADGQLVLAAIGTAPDWVSQVPAIRILRRVWEQQYEEREGQMTFRRTADLPPASELIASPYDDDARWGKKRQAGWVGYKAHVTETCEAAQPLLIVQVHTTIGSAKDQQRTTVIWDDLDRRDLLPATHLVDKGYVDAEGLAAAAATGIRLIGPATGDSQWQAQAGMGYGADDFAVDWDQEQATCPQGVVSQSWVQTTDGDGKQVLRVGFARSDCQGCQAKALCTRGTARRLTLLPRALAAARKDALARQATPAFRQEYRQRAGIEGTISQAVRRTGLRQARYRGIRKVHFEHCAEAAAVNIIRLVDHDAATPRATTRRSRLTRVLSSAA